MQFTITNQQDLDPAALAEELIIVMGSNFGISTAGTTITTNSQPDLTPAQVTQFQAVLSAHVAAAPARKLSQAKTKALDEIDAVAEQVRAKYLTSAPLQAATYVNKANDALKYKLALYPVPFVPASYPYVDAEMRAAGDTTAQAAADRILLEASTYDSVKGAAIEYARRVGKIAVNSATTVTAITTAKTLCITNLGLL